MIKPFNKFIQENWDNMIQSLKAKAAQQKELEAQGKKPVTKQDPKTGKYYVDFSGKKEMKEQKEFPSIKHHKSGLPSKYVAGLTSSEIKAKKAAIKHNAKLSDSNPEAYKDMPGDKRIREKGIPLSKYTKKYHAMYGEAANPAQQAAIAIAMKKAGKKPKNEEVEQVISKTDEGEYGYEGDMAMSQLKSIIRNAKDLHDMMEPKTDLPEWLQAKITLATDYIQTAADYWKSEKEDSVNEEVEQIDEESYAEKIRNHPAVQYYGAGEDHHMINLKKGYHFHFGGSDHMHSSSADNVRTAYQDLKKVKKCSDDKENCEHYNYGEKLEEGAADTSLSAKAKKSGVSLSTLRKVYNRGVAAWNSGHRPGTTPQQWGHARVNSYITHGKTYHTADKDLREEVSLEEAVQYHLDNNISITENVFRPGSDMFFKLISEAKRLYAEGKYKPIDEFEKQMLESDIGEKAMYEGQEVILDFPFEEELNEEESDPTGGHGIGKPFRSNGGGAVYVRSGDGGVHKVNFSQSGMKKRFMEPGRVRSFVARHHCLTNKDKTSAEYWACRWPRFFSNSGKTWW